ncbi:MAG: YeeE/YedE family protein [Xanthomonadaceae bacterium]|nr:YeeE/YedE family protein [Xanthomonadaceae bacterium]
MSSTPATTASFVPGALPPVRHLAAGAAAVAVALYLAYHLAGVPGNGRQLSLSVLLGLAFGVVLQRSRFCFYCVARDFFAARDARGLLGIIAALAVGTLGYHVLFGAFLPDPSMGRLPPGAHIGPVSWVLAAGALSFGFGMALSGSCISAHLYRLGEGSLTSPIALLGALGGFVLGFLSWNTLYLSALQQAPVAWLPQSLGYDGSAALQLGLLGLAAALLAWMHRPVPAAPALPWWQRRWPTYVGGILIGFIGVLAYLRVAPLGVTAELGSIARTLASKAAWIPHRLEGLDGFAGCATTVKQTLWSENGAFVAGLVLGSLGVAVPSGDFRPRLPRLGESVRALIGGVLLGWGSMVALGCTIGTLLSGIMAAAVSGWVFALFALIGTWLGWRLRRWRGW